METTTSLTQGDVVITTFVSHKRQLVLADKARAELVYRRYHCFDLLIHNRAASSAIELAIALSDCAAYTLISSPIFLDSVAGVEYQDVQSTS